MGVYNDRLEVSLHVVVGPTVIPIVARQLRQTIGPIVYEHTGRSMTTINLYIDDIVLDAHLSGDGVA
jgi:uncharacterized alkaline shock family protein YloU